MVLPKNLITAIFFSILVFPAATSTAQNPEIYNYSERNFDIAHYDVFEFLNDASIDREALQITGDTGNENYKVTNHSGRVMFKKRFKLWEETDDIVASFNSTFVVNIYPLEENAVVGEGLAFVIAPDLTMPSGAQGEWLGITNATLDNNTSNQIVAIELDTAKQDYDPDNNHMGLDINSVRSIQNVSLSHFGIDIAHQTKKYSVWVEYNGKSKLLNVYMVEEGNDHTSPVLTANISLKDHVNQYSYLGFAASTGNTVQLNCVVSWDLSIEILPEKKDRTWLKIVVAVGVPALVLLVICVGCYLHKRRVVDDPNILGALKNLPGMPREFKYKDLKKATNNFDEKLKLGQGGFGVVYKGVLPKDNLEVAVKKFSRENTQSKDDFLAELTIINRLRHKHLVRLVGWCYKNGMLFLVYDYMPNRSLDNHLFDGPEKILSWDRRYKIISGVASALNYLHNEYDQKVVHRDLKASNIMLDSDYNARLGDFGLARALDNGRTSYAELQGVPGTFGYIAPECLHTGKATRESDVYGFGVVVLEVICGQRPWTKIGGFPILVDWVWWLHREGRILEAVDERLGNDYVVEEAVRLLRLGLACSHPIASERPKTGTIFQIISGSLPAPDVPPFKPAFVWPTMEPTEDSTMTNTADTLPLTSSGYDGSERHVNLERYT